MVADRRPVPCRDLPPARQHLDHAQQACTHLRSPGRGSQEIPLSRRANDQGAVCDCQRGRQAIVGNVNQGVGTQQIMETNLAGLGTAIAVVGCLDREPKMWATGDSHETDRSLVSRSAYCRNYFAEIVWDHLARTKNAKNAPQEIAPPWHVACASPMRFARGTTGFGCFN